MSNYDYTDRLDEIADAYDALPTVPVFPHDMRRAADAWTELAEHSVANAKILRGMWDIRVTDESEPYADASEMFADILRGKFVVSRANSEHPIWTVEENVAFRIVHDIGGHFAAWTLGKPADFDWIGENNACAEHFADLRSAGYTLAMGALFTECIAQTGSAIRNGAFGPQKIGIIERFDA